MKTIVVFLAVAVSLASKALSGQEAGMGVESYDEAIRIAEERGVDVYLVFKGRTCIWCERQNEVLSSHAAQRHLEGVVLCVLDVQKNKDIAAKQGVTSIPAHRLISPDGTIEKSHTGFMTEREVKRFVAR